MKKTKIICTVGPSTDNIPLLVSMLKAGMDMARFNFSHGSHSEHAQRLGLVREAAEQVNKPIAMIADTRGPEMRLGIFEHDKITLQEGESFCLTTKEQIGNEQIASVNYSGLPDELKVGDAILLADGLLSLEVERINGTEILSEQDIKDITFAIEHDMDYIAASFVQKAEDVLAIRKVLEAAGSGMGIISKIENQAGFTHIDEIIEVSDGVMVARGDLGVEIPAEYVPLVQKEIIRRCNKAGKPVITATQMLESMVNSYRATRAEASDIANAIFDGTDVIMLSGETASGSYPLEAVQTMAKIALRTEEALDYAAIFKGKGISDKIHSTEAISHATVQIAQELDADAIVTVTESGFTARMIAKYRPKCYVVGVSRIPARVRAMQFYWGVRPLLGPSSDNTDEMIEISLKCAREHGYVKDGDSVVITAGVPVGKPGSTNLIKVVNVGNKLVSGVGIGKRSVTGKICTAITLTDFKEKFKPGDVLVVGVLPDEAAAYASKAAAIIAEEGGLTSSVAIIAINCSIPVVVGAENALNLLKDDMEVTVDTVSGIVYEGAINI